MTYPLVQGPAGSLIPPEPVLLVDTNGNPYKASGTGGGGGGVADTLWTDDSAAYYVRVDTGASVAWNDINGAPSTAPGTGARPVDVSAAVTTIQYFQAAATVAGQYATGDFIAHVATVNPTSGAPLGSFWENISAATHVSPPAAANIAPVGGASSLAQLPASLGQKTSANALGVVLASDQPAVATMPPASVLQYADAARTRSNVATAYAANQSIGDATDSQFKFSNLFRVNGGSGYLNELRLFASKAGGLTIPAGIVVRAMLYNLSAAAAADYAAFSLTEALRAGEGRLGFVDFTTTYAGGAGSDQFEMVAAPTWPMLLQAAGGTRDLYVALIATGAWTPTASMVLNLRASVSLEQ